jgi:hypothetical protein
VHVELRLLEDRHDARRVLLVAVARDLDEVERDVDRHRANEVGEEEDRALEDAERDELGAFEFGADLPSHLRDPLVDLCTAD